MIKNINKRLIALALAGTMTFSLIGCSKKKENKSVSAPTNSLVQLQDNNIALQNDMLKLFPTLNKEIIENAALILLLNKIAPKDENGKINTQIISTFKSKLDVDNMMDDFNSFLDALEQKMLNENKLVLTNNLVIEEDQKIITQLELITNSILTGTEEDIKKNFDLIYTLFVLEDEITYNDFKFEIRDLSYSGREVASVYARVVLNKANSLIDNEKIDLLDKRTNNQNSKAYIKTQLEILSNNMNEVSKIDVVGALNKKYEEVKSILNGKITIDEDTLKDLVNYLNIEYLNSDNVSNKDKKNILGEYSEEQINNVLLAIDAITEHNQTKDSIIPLSKFLLEEYTKTETGKVDKVVLDSIVFNSSMFVKYTDENTKAAHLFKNSNFEKLYLYIRKADFTHQYPNTDVVNIDYKNISDGVKFVGNEINRYTINKRPNIKEYGIEKQVNINLEETIQYLQNTISGECEKVEVIQFVK